MCLFGAVGGSVLFVARKFLCFWHKWKSITFLIWVLHKYFYTQDKVSANKVLFWCSTLFMIAVLKYRVFREVVLWAIDTGGLLMNVLVNELVEFATKSTQVAGAISVTRLGKFLETSNTNSADLRSLKNTIETVNCRRWSRRSYIHMLSVFYSDSI